MEEVISFFSSTELKSHVSFSNLNLSVDFSHFFFSRTTGPILTKLGTNHPWVKGIRVCPNEGPRPFWTGDNNKKVKMYWQDLTIFSSRTTGPIPTKHITKHHLVNRSQVYSNEWPHPFPRGENFKIVKLLFKNLWKPSSLESLGQFQPNLAQSILWWKGFKFVQMNGPVLFQGEIITK